MKHAPYAKYRPSGVNWLGDVPEHWELNRLKCSVTRSNQKIEAGETSGLPYVGLEDVASWTGNLLPSVGALEPESLSNTFASGDVLFGKLRPYLAKGFLASSDGLCSTEFLVLRPKHLDPSYLLNLLLTHGFISMVDSSTYGARMPRASWDFIGNTPLPLPPQPEQRAIAAFLDREVAKVDALIAKKHQLIDRLAEYRTALVTRTVTRGLPPDVADAEGFDPSPRLKPSGVEWLGEIPEHWEVVQLGRLGSFFKGGGGTKEDEIDGGLPCIRYGALYTQHQFVIRQSRSGIAEISSSKYKRLQYGDLLFAGSGETIEEIGKSAANLIEGPAYCGGDVIGFRPSVEVDSTFFGYAADSPPATYQKACMGRGVTVMHIYSSELRHLLLPLPPIEEQKAIATYLDRQMERIAALCSWVEAAIERLLEYRTALITAAVTGKIDVRDRVSFEAEDGTV